MAEPEDPPSKPFTPESPKSKHHKYMKISHLTENTGPQDIYINLHLIKKVLQIHKDHTVDISIPGSCDEVHCKLLWVLMKGKFYESNLDEEGLRLLRWLDEGLPTWAVTPASFLASVEGPRE